MNFSLTSIMHDARRDYQLFEAALNTALSGEEEFATDFVHLTGILPFPQGRKSITQKHVIWQENQCWQRLLPGVSDDLIKYANAIRALIWLPVAERKDFDKRTNERFDCLKREFDNSLYRFIGLEDNSVKETNTLEAVAKELVIFLKAIDVIPYPEREQEDEYEIE